MTKQERYTFILNYFEKNVGLAETELHYNNPFELIVAVSLSAQCTDKRVNLTTPKLFKNYPSPFALSKATSDTIFTYIRSISYPNNKAKNLVGMAKMLVEDFNSEIPDKVDDLIKLPGVGRKTANVIASVIFNQPTMAVDTHVFRVSNRIGLTTNAKTPLQSELQLIKFIPKELVPRAHHWLILHGRYVCLARTPKCAECKLSSHCKYFEKEISKQNKNLNVLNNSNLKSMAKKLLPATKSSVAQKKVIKKIILKKVIKKAIKKVVKKAAKKTVKKAVKKITKKVEKKTTVKKTIDVKKIVKSAFMPHSTKLKVGQIAPYFEGKDQHGNLVSSSALLGKTVILYFYPKDDTPGCTATACSLRDEYQYLNKSNIEVVGVSADDEKSHAKFAKKYDLPFSLLADTNLKIMKTYDVWGTKQFMGKIYDGIIRTTFVIDADGVLKNVITKVDTTNHAQQILAE